MRLTVCLSLVAVILTACAAGETETGGSAPKGNDAGSHASGIPTREWNPDDWHPTEVITRRTYTEEELERKRREIALQSFSNPEDRLNQPDIAIIEVMRSPQEAAHARAECLQKSGFNAQAMESGGIKATNVPQSQEPAYELASYVCQMQYPMDPAITEEWSAEQIGLVYDYWNEYMIPCLEDHGVTVNTSKRPSRESYIQNFHAPDGAGREWYPTDQQAYLENVEGKIDVVKACPAMPPSDVLYGAVTQ